MSLPKMFCWSKFGTESGEPIESILERKESERRRNGGTFLWGIGSAIGPGVAALVQETVEPEVVFSPMLSRAAPADASPAEVLVWTTATGLDGLRYEMPSHSIVTSRAAPRGARERHYALVCSSQSTLQDASQELALDHTTLRNLRSGNRLGASQVTSVVSRGCAERAAGARYRVAFRAQLIYPYVLELAQPIRVNPTELSDLHAYETRAALLQRLRLSQVNNPPASSDPYARLFPLDSVPLANRQYGNRIAAAY